MPRLHAAVHGTTPARPSMAGADDEPELLAHRRHQGIPEIGEAVHEELAALGIFPAGRKNPRRISRAQVESTNGIR